MPMAERALAPWRKPLLLVVNILVVVLWGWGRPRPARPSRF